ncbi:E3 ubiquitin-protein ligase TRIM39-like isoform X2 [Pleurodeles waltl]|uniref:E3 ubiquitin-protein ligase TRIM39-like isoform X2 n=1 Tax=Pleurodeles waltl TaxID=8319 RepID=UPI003709B70F
MASADLLRGLNEEATCSICLEYFTDPVSVECGHVFCLSCISEYWMGWQNDCPQCRGTFPNKTLLPNKQLANVAEKLKQLQTQTTSLHGANLCKDHEEKLKLFLFCEDEHEPTCAICRESNDHEAHSARHIREAAQEHKGKLHNCLATLQNSLKNIDVLQCKEQQRVIELEEAARKQELKILSTFEEQKMCLEQKKQQELSRMKTKHNESLNTVLRNISELEHQKAALMDLVSNIKDMCQQQDMKLLKVVKSIFHRFDNIWKSKANSAGTKLSIQKFIQLLTCLLDKIKQVKTSRACHLWTNYGLILLAILPAIYGYFSSRACQLRRNYGHILLLLLAICGYFYLKSHIRFAAEVTLDPDTAHRWLILSEDRRSVRMGDRAQDVPNTPQRFHPVIAVLGREKLSSGRHYWEVEVGNKTGWTLGVCDEAVSRTGEITASPEVGYWIVQLRNGEYRAVTDPSTLLTIHVPPRAVGLFLDYEEGRLLVYNVNDCALLFSFSGASFPPTLRPFFSPETNEGGRNAGALRIQPVTRWV